MTPERRRRTESLFLDAVDLPIDDRTRFLEESCGDDSEIRREVESLLRHDGAGEFLDVRNLGIRATEALDSLERAGAAPPQFVDGYRLICQIGRGGTATVYEAEQHSPRRTVALKIVHGGPGAHGLRRRFEREIEVLGRLTHPGIAQIYDAGVATTPTGVFPYFAMELVRGPTLTEFAKRNRLGVRARLALLAEVCDAVQFAHDKGIIHRDLKPANILVGSKGSKDQLSEHDNSRAVGASQNATDLAAPVPKVLDFGVARMMDADVQLTVEETNVAQLIGTIPYMSPEQLRGKTSQLDTRTDIYSLGVMLYQLLGGRLPHDLRECSIAEAARAIQHDEPTRLSMISTVFRGDIETLVAKALEKDPNRRFQSAAEFAADIRRFLRDEPIRSRPPSSLYQLRKFAKRNRSLVTAVALVFVCMIVATAVSTRFAISESRQREISDRRAHRANIIAAHAQIRDGDAIQARRILESASAPERETWEWRYLDAALDTANQVLIGHDGPVQAVCFLSDGTRLVSASSDRTLRVWDLASGQTTQVLSGHTGAVRRVQCLDSLNRVISASEDGTLRVWDVDAGQTLQEMPCGAGVVDLATSADGNLAIVILISPTRPSTRLGARFDYQVWNVNSGLMELSMPIPQTQAAHSLTTACDDSEIFFATGNGITCVDLRSGERIARAGFGHDDSALRITRGESMLATCANDKTIALWDETAFLLKGQLRGHLGPIRAVCFGAHDDFLASGGEDWTVRTWNTRTQSQSSVLLGHDERVNDVQISPDSRHLVSASNDGTLRIWDLDDVRDARTYGVCRGHVGPVYDVAFAPCGQSFASAGWQDCTIRLWDSASRRVTRLLVEEGGQITRLAFSPDGRHLAFASRNVCIVDVESGEIRRLGAAGGVVRSLAFSPDGSTLFSTSIKTRREPRSVVCAWDRSSGDLKLETELEGDALVSSSNAGMRLAVFEQDGAHMLDALSNRTLFGFAGHGGGTRIERMSFSPDGARFVTASHDGTAAVWDAHDGRLIGRLVGHQEKVYDAKFSPDGSRIATCSNDNSIMLWRSDTLEQILELHGHERYVFALAFSDDGNTLVSASGDGTLRVWPTQPRAARTPRHSARSALRFE